MSVGANTKRSEVFWSEDAVAARQRLGATIKERRLAHGLKRPALCEELDHSVFWLLAVENGRAWPTLGDLGKLMLRLGFEIYTDADGLLQTRVPWQR